MTREQNINQAQRPLPFHPRATADLTDNERGQFRRMLAQLRLSAAGISLKVAPSRAYTTTITRPRPAALLQRAIVYVRQPTQSQVMTSPEGQSHQYDLVETARTYGFTTVGVIGDDPGISASGCAGHPGFERLIAALCTGGVGAVFCLDSRPARPSRACFAYPCQAGNGRDRHHVPGICGMVEARVIDQERRV